MAEPARALEHGPGHESAPGPVPLVSVLVPCFEQAAFLPRALSSALDQRLEGGGLEVVVVDDGSDDAGATGAALALFADDPRVRVLRHGDNRGLGAAANTALDAARAPVVAWLPADDVWAAGHLASVLAALDAAPRALAAAADLVEVPPHAPGWPQLVQVAHRRSPARWAGRPEVETDDLDLAYWSRLRAAGGADAGDRAEDDAETTAEGWLVRTGAATAAWTQHPGQRSRALRESLDGGLNVFRTRYRVREPLRVVSTDSGAVDEVALHAADRARHLEPAPDGLRLLVVGDLGFNPDRLLVLAERGHRLHGLWTTDGLGDSGVGPLACGHVAELREDPRADWRAPLADLAPDAVYALLSWRAVPLAHAVLTHLRGAGGALARTPFVFHLKEAPQACVRSGTWPLLVDLVRGSDAVVLSTEEERDHLRLAVPGALAPERTLVVDGDLPRAALHGAERSRRLSQDDGEVHTAVVGRPLGLDAALLAQLAGAGVHTHFHGLVDAPGPAAGWRSWLAAAREAAPGRVHVHPRVAPPDWTAVLSRYDAGWLHRTRSSNGGDLRRATWDDLNAPARLGPLAAAGLPVLQRASPGHAVAVDRLVGPPEAGGDGSGVLYADDEDLLAQLADPALLARRSAAAWRTRGSRTFDAHAPALERLLRELVASR
ncbi:glycosyltransferase [Quadrisphaera sp. KR29]|uniref:glycosyltransferase n=1 Tax=Quadrisphaera sp. KR29 TaxID=3461391 RepID=UPI004043A15A